MDQSVADGNPEYSAYLLSPYMIPGSEFDLDLFGSVCGQVLTILKE